LANHLFSTNFATVFKVNQAAESNINPSTNLINKQLNHGIRCYCDGGGQGISGCNYDKSVSKKVAIIEKV
jgi:hypothetical protein